MQGKMIPVLDTIVRMVFQCLKYRIRVSGYILGSTDGLLEDWGLWLRGCFGGLLDGGSLHRWSHFRSFVEIPVTEHVFPSIKILTTNERGNRVVVGFLVAFLSIGTAEFFSADITGIGLRRIYKGFHVAGEIALLRKLFPTFVTHVLLKRYNRNIRYVWVKSSIFLYSCFELWSSFLFVQCIYI